MHLGIKGKQVLGVTSIVGGVVVILSLLHLSRLASVSLDESRARAELLANAVYHRAREVVNDGVDPLNHKRQFLTERRLAGLHRGKHHVLVGVGGADDDDRVDVGVVEQFLRLSVRSAHIEFRRDGPRQFRVRIRDSRELGFGKPRRQVARVHTAEPPETNQSNLQLHFFPLSLAAFG